MNMYILAQVGTISETWNFHHAPCLRRIWPMEFLSWSICASTTKTVAISTPKKGELWWLYVYIYIWLCIYNMYIYMTISCYIHMMTTFRFGQSWKMVLICFLLMKRQQRPVMPVDTCQLVIDPGSTGANCHHTSMNTSCIILKFHFEVSCHTCKPEE